MIAPVVGDGAIGYGAVSRVADLPLGWGDEQDAGRYRLRRRLDAALFGFASGAQSAKPVFFPAEEVLWRGRRTPEGFAVDADAGGGPDAPYALLGVRSCDLSAIGIHDVVLTGRVHADVAYAARRSAAFVVAVTCSDPSGTCFCVSMGTGPRPRQGRGAPYDLSLTELIGPTGPHRFVVEVASERGAEILDEIGAARRAGRRRRGRRPRGGGRSRPDGSQPGHGRPQGPAVRRRGQPDLGRRRRPLPGLRQLHRGLPDLLLHRTSRTSPTWRATSPAVSGSGTPASTPTTRTSTAGPCEPRRGRATGSG